MSDEGKALCLGIVIALVLVVAYLAVCGKLKIFRGDTFIPRDGPRMDLVDAPIDALIEGGNDKNLGLGPYAPLEKKSIFDTINLFYTTDQVDPLITGQGYEFRDNTRDVYTGRTSLGGKSGLQEFSVNAVPGMMAVDVGPYALSEYSGSILGFSDGIPEQWAFPSTPIRWYRPAKEDYYGRDGPAINNDSKLYPLYVQDNDPLIGADPDPRFI